MADAALSLVARTAASTGRTRVSGLAAEAAFFSLLSLPALLLGLLGTLGHLAIVIGEQTVLQIRAQLLDTAATVLTSDTVDAVVAPMVDEFLSGAQGSVLSLTFLVSLWSGSRAMNVFIEAITIAYGVSVLRGYLRRRLLAFVAYLGALVFALLVLPILVAGPNLIRQILPPAAELLNLAYWPTTAVLCLLCLVALYALSIPVRVRWRRHLPGALLGVVILLLGSAALRLYLGASFGQTTTYSSLAAPIAILAWFYVIAIAVLVGAVLNAEIDAMWPTETTAVARAEIAADRHADAMRMVERRERALADLAESTEVAKKAESTEEAAEAEAAGEVRGRSAAGGEPSRPPQAPTADPSQREPTGTGRDGQDAASVTRTPAPRPPETPPSENGSPTDGDEPRGAPSASSAKTPSQAEPTWRRRVRRIAPRRR
ncbi:hypothetical protein GCM10022402_06390 [Salinactinospora qingdaonensis]|uniref:YihY family inner membrane protein n=2 Tax=Salinactinospora qingdaonensis TaxID=702744 RepID=A0ABP7F1H3_9ACTN